MDDAACPIPKPRPGSKSTIVLIVSRADDFEARSNDELSLSKGDRIELIERDDDFGDGWYLGKHTQANKTGLFPEGRMASSLHITIPLIQSQSIPPSPPDQPAFLQILSQPLPPW